MKEDEFMDGKNIVPENKRNWMRMKEGNWGSL